MSYRVQLIRCKSRNLWVFAAVSQEILPPYFALAGSFQFFATLHYYTTPCLAWDAALRMSCVDLELITDIDVSFHREIYSR